MSERQGMVERSDVKTKVNLPGRLNHLNMAIEV